jgi:hypothetical protein
VDCHYNLFEITRAGLGAVVDAISIDKCRCAFQVKVTADELGQFNALKPSTLLSMLEGAFRTFSTARYAPVRQLWPTPPFVRCSSLHLFYFALVHTFEIFNLLLVVCGSCCIYLLHASRNMVLVVAERPTWRRSAPKHSEGRHRRRGRVR